MSSVEAQTLLRQGRRQEAEAAYARVLESNPNHVESLNVIAMSLLERGDGSGALALLQRAQSADPKDAITCHHLARVCERLGDDDAAIQAYSRSIQLNPNFNLARLHYAAALEKRGATDQALLHYSRAIKQAQMNGRWLDPASTPTGLQPLVEHAVELIRAGRRALFFNMLKPLIDQYGRDALDRVEQCLRIYLGEAAPTFADARQQPTFLFFPGLPTSPYVDRQWLPWADDLEQKTPEVRRELEIALLHEEGRERVFLDDKSEGQNLRGAFDTPSWNGYYFFRHGARRDENHVRCPITSASLDALPLVRIEHHAPEVLFSVFTSGTHLLPHRGVTNTRVVGHLPLIIPEHCALNVGGELHEWREGKVVVFDDTYEHEAWNRSRSTRVVLIFDLWNPHLAEVERAALRDIVVAIGGLREAEDNSSSQ